jgi:hypothetical protein
MANGGGSTITIKKLIWSKAFNRGFKEVREGIPLNYDAYINHEHNQWSYERGRQFALEYEGKLKYGKEVNVSALYRFADSWQSRAII